jgi:DNA-binding transcriptional MerR regulator
MLAFGGEADVYTIGQLAKLAGVTTRTLRYYDQIGLLKPAKTNETGYRLYGPKQVDTLQQILFYRELGVGPEEIIRIISAPSFDRQRALESHLKALIKRREALDALISTVSKTLEAHKGGLTMTDEEKFEGFKKKLIKENEEKYGAEARSLYGDAVVDESNAKLMGMTPAQFARMQMLSAEVNEALKMAMQTSDPTGEEARRLCELHKQWLMCTWPHYSAAAHRGLAQMYMDDERFKAYYDSIAPGAAVFLRDALLHFLPEA